MLEIDAINKFFTSNGIWFIKIPILFLILLYTVFLFIIMNRITAFDRIVHITATKASGKLKMFAKIQLILAISLFLLTLVIV